MTEPCIVCKKYDFKIVPYKNPPVPSSPTRFIKDILLWAGWKLLPILVLDSMSQTGRFSAGLFKFKKVLICDNCGLGVIDRMPSTRELSKYYRFAYQEVGEVALSELGREPINSEQARAYGQVAWLSEHIELNSISSSLDVGAGQGSFLRRLRDLYPDVVTTALEPSTSSCAVMEESGEISNVINGLNLPKTRFDLIVSSHTLEHVEDVVKTMREYFNALNVGGYLFVEVPFASEQHFDAAHEYLPHTFFFTPKSMYVLAEVVGFNMVKTETGGISYLDLVAGRSKLGWQLDVWRKSGVMGANLRVLLQRCR